jgi:Trk K+ transport system NAD-binding subunit
VLLAPILLPRRETVAASFARDPREYVVSAYVRAKTPLVGKSVEAAGLRRLPNLFLIEVRRVDGTVLAAPAPTTELHADDTLLFAGDVHSVNDLWEHGE